MASKTHRVVIADDHALVRDYLRALLAAEADIEVIGVASDGAEALRVAVESRPDVLVLDNSMPVLGGLEVLRELREAGSNAAVVMYTAEPGVRASALRAGAHACVAKEDPPASLIAAIRDAAERQTGGVSTTAASVTVESVDAFTPVRPSELRGAIADKVLGVAMQPLVELRTRRLSGVEALCRWSHPVFGSIPPTRFIPVAELSGLITPLTLYVARTAAAQLGSLRAQKDLRLNLNLSLASLLDPAFYDEFILALEEAAWAPRDLTIEVTETMLMREPAATADALGRLRALGMHVHVDDFGTGFSSLGRLIDLPIDGVKIDRRFVGTMTRERKSESIVRAIVALAHDLGLEVVAEGVEDRETWELLGAWGCDTVQGFYVAVPMPALSLPAWLASWEADLAASSAPSRDRSSATEVLVVDDEPVIVEVIRGILEHEGFRVVTAANGAEALRELERRLPALVLLDMQMPIVDGQAFVRAVRDRKLNVPIVVMTAGSSAARWARELSVNAYLSKPFDIDRLVEVTSLYAARH